MRFDKYCGPCAFSRSTLYFWIGKARRGRTDLSEIPGHGMPPDESLATVIARWHEQDPHLPARKVAQSLRTSSTTVSHYLLDILGLKCPRRHSVPRTLTIDQNAERAEYADPMPQILTAHESARLHFLYTDDESWMLYSHHEWTRWVAS
jgi:hypothetical protein